jgi:hypothetical protein
MCTLLLLCVILPLVLRAQGIRVMNWKNEKWHTFDHLTSGQCIFCTLLVTGCVVEEEEPLHMSICAPFKNVDCVVDLGK